MSSHPSRRATLALAGAATAVALTPIDLARASNAAQGVIAAFTGGKAPSEGRITIDAPEIAENGNAVPVTFAVQSAMTDADHVVELIVVADANPRPGVCTFKFTRASLPEANTRIRLGETQNIVAVAKMGDGSFVTASRNVKVTIGGCGG